MKPLNYGADTKLVITLLKVVLSHRKWASTFFQQKFVSSHRLTNFSFEGKQSLSLYEVSWDLPRALLLPEFETAYILKSNK